MKTAVVILNYNTRNYLEQFLPGLIASCEGLDAGVVVADNASADTSVEFMKTRFPEIPLIELDKNYGFTGGYNRALEQVEAEAEELGIIFKFLLNTKELFLKEYNDLCNMVGELADAARKAVDPE